MGDGRWIAKPNKPSDLSVMSHITFGVSVFLSPIDKAPWHRVKQRLMWKKKVSNAFCVVPEVVVRLSRGSYVGTEGSLVGPLFVAVTFRAHEAPWNVVHIPPRSWEPRCQVTPLLLGGGYHQHIHSVRQLEML